MIRRTQWVCIDIRVFEKAISPIALRIYCQIHYESVLHGKDGQWDSDFSESCSLPDEEVEKGLSELVNAGLITIIDGLLAVVDLSPTPTPKAKAINTLAAIQIEQHNYIYVIHAVSLGIYKVGYTKNIARRFKELCNQQIPSDLGLIASYKIANAAKVETYLHGLFADKEVHNEWFCLTKKDLSEIDTRLTEMGGVRESGC